MPRRSRSRKRSRSKSRGSHGSRKKKRGMNPYARFVKAHFKAFYAKAPGGSHKAKFRAAGKAMAAAYKRSH